MAVYDFLICWKQDLRFLDGFVRIYRIIHLVDHCFRPFKCPRKVQPQKSSSYSVKWFPYTTWAALIALSAILIGVICTTSVVIRQHDYYTSYLFIYYSYDI